MGYEHDLSKLLNRLRLQSPFGIVPGFYKQSQSSIANEAAIDCNQIVEWSAARELIPVKIDNVLSVVLIGTVALTQQRLIESKMRFSKYGAV